MKIIWWNIKISKCCDNMKKIATNKNLVLLFLRVDHKYHHVLDYPFHQLIHFHQTIQLDLRKINFKEVFILYAFPKMEKNPHICLISWCKFNIMGEWFAKQNKYIFKDVKTLILANQILFVLETL